jgi:hypothetical protein
VKENAKVIYIYFDYKAQANQTELYVAGTLLKQILYQVPDIPADIESFYNDFFTKNKIPSANDLTRFLTAHSKPRTYAILDALDECNDEYQQEILSLLNVLEKSGFKLLISMRPHLKIDRGHLISIKAVTIEANDADLGNYVLTILQVKNNKINELKRQCLELIKEAKGM